MLSECLYAFAHTRWVACPIDFGPDTFDAITSSHRENKRDLLRGRKCPSYRRRESARALRYHTTTSKWRQRTSFGLGGSMSSEDRDFSDSIEQRTTRTSDRRTEVLEIMTMMMVFGTSASCRAVPVIWSSLHRHSPAVNFWASRRQGDSCVLSIPYAVSVGNDGAVFTYPLGVQFYICW